TYQYFSSLMELASSVDTLINVAPATGQTQNAVDSKILQALGPNGVFINIGRGATVAEDELARALHDGTIAAAGLDVYANEPNVHDQLLTAPNTVLLPHIASASVHTRAAMGQLVVDNLVGWFTERSVMTPVPETLHLVENRSTT
ncbi:MAG: NAD(P)-dependent oxidoreductase, partial [Pseudomonadota bacterium]